MSDNDIIGRTVETKWKPIKTAPKDGRLVELGWLPNGHLEHSVKSRWRSGEGWLGHWTPTHWRPVTTDQQGAAP